MDEDDGFVTSDAEIDSEVEDTDDGELGIWLDQLNAYTQEESRGPSLTRKTPLQNGNITLTPKKVMDSFRTSVLDAAPDDLDLDALLGELCMLEDQLSTQQSELNTSIAEADIPTAPAPGLASKTPGPAVKEKPKVKDKPSPPGVKDKPRPPGVKDRPGPPGVKVTPSPGVKDKIQLEKKDKPQINGALKNPHDSFAELESALDNELSELSDLIGETFNGAISITPPPTHQYNSSRNKYLTSGQSQSYSSNHVQMTQDNITVHIPSSSSRKPHDENGKFLGNSQGNGHVTQFLDYSPDGADVDSAFSDSGSLPSSGSHVSVTTTSSQNSNGSGSGSSGLGLTNNVAAEWCYGMYEQETLKRYLFNYQQSLQKLQLPLAEHAARMKEEKMKIALEKIKEANIQKLFVRCYSEDGCSKSILVDDKMTVALICDRLITKNTVKPGPQWSIVEHLTDLHMERLLEDHELVVESLFMWTRDSQNKLLFVESMGKYHIFDQPEIYLRPEKKEEDMTESSREALIQEYFNEDSAQFPDVEGQLYLKSEGKKAWKKFYFVLRASGLYYSPKGKGKTSKDLLCLQKLELVEVYTAVGWKKKYKAPTEFGFALKHPQIQKKAPKYIKYLCAEDQCTFSRWVTGIRIAKLGYQLWQNYLLVQKNIRERDTRDELPNQNFAEYLAKQNERNEEFAKENKLLPRKSVCHRLEGVGEEREENYYRYSSVSCASSGHEPSVSKMSVHSNDEVSPRKLSEIGDGFCRRGSLPGLLDGRQPSNQSMDYNQNQEYKGSDEDLRPDGKMIPKIPVTTNITRQLTDQNAANGTLKRRTSLGTMKVHKRNMSVPDDRLPTSPNRYDHNGYRPGTPERALSPVLNHSERNGTSMFRDRPSTPERLLSPNPRRPSTPEGILSPINRSISNDYSDGSLRARTPERFLSPVHKNLDPTLQHQSPSGRKTPDNMLSSQGSTEQLPLPQAQTSNKIAKDYSNIPRKDQTLPPPPFEQEEDSDGDEFPLPPPPPELLSQPLLHEEVAYSVVNVSQPSGPKPWYSGCSLPNSPQKRPPVLAKPKIGQIPSQGHPFSAPQSPTSLGNLSTQREPYYAVPTSLPVAASPIRRQAEPPAYITPPGSTIKRPPPPTPKRSKDTKLSLHAGSPQAQYFISDLNRVLNQKCEWSQHMGPEPSSFPPTPPPPRPHVPSQPPPAMDEWLPPPPAELLEGLAEARKRVPPPTASKPYSPKKSPYLPPGGTTNC